MKRTGPFLVVMTALLAVLSPRVAGQEESRHGEPRFTADNQLLRPDNYREWIWLSSGLGMSYGPVAKSTGDAGPPFDNVFVSPEAYRSFLQTGKWPDKTILVLELRASQSKGSINQHGHFQGELLRMEAEVKDESRFPGKWAFFSFETEAASAKPLLASASCYSCHAENGAVDNTFVQFYPTLLEVAKRKGTLQNPQEGSEAVSAPEH